MREVVRGNSSNLQPRGQRYYLKDIALGERDAAAAKRFFQRGLANPGNSRPRVVNVDQNRAYPAAVDELKKDGTIGRRCKL